MSLIKANSNVWFPSFVDELFKPDWLGGVENEKINNPAVNIIESDEGFALELAVPGRKKDDFAIEVNDGVLSISSENKKEKNQSATKNYKRKEFVITSFKRSFTIPETIDENKINAAYQDGLLTITLLKKEEALPQPKRQIEVS